MKQNFSADELSALLEQGNVLPSDFGALVGVSRATVWNWTKGRSVLRFIVPRANKVFSALSSALADGRLPIIERMTAAKRQAYLASLIDPTE